MVKLFYPQSSSPLYAEIEGYLWGPYLHQPADPTDYIDLKVDDDYGHLSERHGIYGENDVSHQKVDGLIIYQPALQGTWPNSTGQLPEQIRGNPYYGSSPLLTDFEYGLAISGKCSIVATWYYQVDRRTWATALYKEDGWHKYQISLRSDQPGDAQTWTHQHYTNFRFLIRNNKPQMQYDVCSEYFDTPVRRSGIDLWNRTTHDVLCRFPEIMRKVPLVASQKDLLTGELSFVSDWVSPGQIRKLVAAECGRLSLDEFPLKPIHDGELSYEAAKKIQASNVNMLEFLRDIRKPWELIPKLRNMSLLKNVANNYLMVDYGILPTVDDLKSIVRAFTKRMPYLDKNGYATYSSYNIQSLVDSDCNYSLEQRAKIAVANDDDTLLALTKRLDDFGLYPRFEYMWDLIPYSFVIDWFLDVGQFLERIDTRLQLLRLNIRYTTLSHRKSASISLDSTAGPISGTLSLVQYHRWVTDHCPAPPLSLQLSSDPLSHFIDGGALIIQRHN